jgi:hypothetical protein
MEQFVEELRKLVKFKDTTEVGDLVLIVTETPQACLYGLVSGFERDQRKRDEWWRITLQVLTVPPQEISWILRPEQFTGREIFTMGGEKRFIKAVDLGFKATPPARPDGGDKSSGQPKLRLVK